MLPEYRYDCIYIVIRKLYRHYKLGKPNLLVTSGRNNSSCGRWNITINQDDASWGTIAHEVAHALMFQKYGKPASHHNRKHKMRMKRVLKYIARKHYFEVELARRLRPKEPKPEPTKEESEAMGIVTLELKIKRYRGKLKMYSTKLKKAERRLRAKLKHRGAEAIPPSSMPLI